MTNMEFKNIAIGIIAGATATGGLRGFLVGCVTIVMLYGLIALIRRTGD